MFNAFAHPFFCTSNTTAQAKVFDKLKAIMEYPKLTLEEKWLWIWLATCSAKNFYHACAFTFKDLSHVANLSCKQVHRALFRLCSMGFLRVEELPICYGQLTAEMCSQSHLLFPVLPSKAILTHAQKLKDHYFMDLTTHVKNPINMNLLKRKLENQHD